MTSSELERLVQSGLLKREQPAEGEVQGLLRLGEARLADARNSSNSVDGRFVLAYNSAHALALAALRRLGYRPANRYIVFQSLAHTLGLPAKVWRVLAKAHDVRNRAEYEGVVETGEPLVSGVVEATGAILDALNTSTGRTPKP
jgi:hypothetical protein